MYVHTCAYTHKHTDWACTTCSDFGFLFRTLFLQSVDLHTCLCTIFVTHTHTHTRMHTQSELVPRWVLICFHKGVHVHECTHLYTQLHCYVNSLYTIFVTHTRTHTHTHTHTHRACTTCSDCAFLSRTLFLQSVCEHECTHLCAHTQRLGLYHLE